jgi:hypothetical protein
VSADLSADRVVDEILPEELDWSDLVVRYPKTSLAVVALGGFLLGRSRGKEMVLTLSAFAADRVVEGVNQYLGQEIL